MVARVQSRQAKAAFDGAAVAGVEFPVGERFQGLREAEVLIGGVGDHLVEFLAHGRQRELVQLQVQWSHESPFGIAV